MAVDLLSEQEVALAPLFAQSFHSATYVSIFFRKKVRSFYSVMKTWFFRVIFLAMGTISNTSKTEQGIDPQQLPMLNLTTD
jgi:hypothetical protein